MSERPPTRHGALEHRLPALVLVGGLPAVAVALWWLWSGAVGMELRWTLSALIVVAWLGAAAAAHEMVAQPLRTLAGLLGALREGDYSLRGADHHGTDAFAQAVREANEIGALLQSQRLGAVEATTLLRTVLHEIDVAVLVFDDEGTLRVVNRAGAEMLGRKSEWLLGRSARELGLQDALARRETRVHDVTLPGVERDGRWELRRSTVRQDGRTHHLLVFADLSHALRAEERQAWQRMVRVLGHEINNSLAPIKSLARSVERILARPSRDASADAEVQHALRVIGGRADALGRFLQAYARVTQLPPPRPRPMRVAEWVDRVVAMEPRLPVERCAGPDITIAADPDQLDQLLINLVRNAADAALGDGGGGHVWLAWTAHDGALRVTVEDDGPGIADATHLFVPFFTTKPGGSGVGLALSRQIAEAHGGTLVLEERDGRGGRAVLVLPASGMLRQPTYGEADDPAIA